MITPSLTFAVLVLILIIALGILFAMARIPMGATPSGSTLDRMRQSTHFKDGKFVNSLPTKMFDYSSTFTTIRMYLEPAVRTPRSPIPTESIPNGFFDKASTEGLRITWLGHSAFLIELDGARILTDPALFSRASPYSWIGPKRFFPSPLAIKDMPDFDAVFISHDHYDHLAMDEIQALVPKTKKFIVPLGIGATLQLWGVPVEKIVELDWWETESINAKVKLVLTPARHFSGRGFKGDRTLWSSAAFMGPNHRVFFSGDTGMCPEFTDIGQKVGPFDATLIKIGAYSKTWPDIHLNPEQALEVNRIVRGKVLIPAHWGTYNLAIHSWYEPADRLVAEAAKTGTTIIVPKPGRSIVPANPPPLDRWWDALK